MKCFRCKRPALRQVNNHGFCGTHLAEANREQAQTIRRIDQAEGERQDLQRDFLRKRSHAITAEKREREKARWRE